MRGPVINSCALIRLFKINYMGSLVDTFTLHLPGAVWEQLKGGDGRIFDATHARGRAALVEQYKDCFEHLFKPRGTYCKKTEFFEVFCNLSKWLNLELSEDWCRNQATLEEHTHYGATNC